MPSKSAVIANQNILAASGLSGKTMTGINVHSAGDVVVIEISYSGGSTFIKEKKGVVKVGGDAEWETGTQVRF